MKKFLTLTVLCLSVFMANAFTCGDYAYKPWSVEDLLIGFPSKPVILGQYSIYISDQAVTLFECINKDIKKAEIPSFASDEGNDHVIQYVKYSAFEECANLTEVVIGDSLKLLPDITFASSPVKKLVWNAENCVIETDYPILLDDSLLTWRDLTRPFEQVEDLVIGDNVKVLPNVFMAHSEISSVTIPKSVTNIYEFAFSGCHKLQSVHVQAMNPSMIELERRVFEETAENCTLYVPKGSAGLYRQAKQWKEFKNIVEEGEDVDNPYDLNHDGQVDVTDVNLLIDRILGKK